MFRYIQLDGIATLSPSSDYSQRSRHLPGLSFSVESSCPYNKCKTVLITCPDRVGNEGKGTEKAHKCLGPAR